jgi:hypothetical protein
MHLNISVQLWSIERMAEHLNRHLKRSVSWIFHPLSHKKLLIRDNGNNSNARKMKTYKLNYMTQTKSERTYVVNYLSLLCQKQAFCIATDWFQGWVRCEKCTNGPLYWSTSSALRWTEWRWPQESRTSDVDLRRSFESRTSLQERRTPPCQVRKPISVWV